MSDRRPYVGGNWKMNGSLAMAAELADDVAAATRESALDVDIAIFPPFPYLQAVGHALRGAEIEFGGQDCCPHLDGAYTGQTSPAMIADLGGSAVLVGHSERRHGLGESDELLAAKLRAGLAAGLTGVLCVGETQTERSEGIAADVVEKQVRRGLEGLDRDLVARTVIAYEPVWAIGTGLTPSLEDAEAAHKALRTLLGSLYDSEFAETVRIVYGGSMNTANAAEFISSPEIDGGLIGGASLKGDEFLAICRDLIP